MKKTRFIALWLAAAVCWLGVAAGTAAASDQAVVIVDGGGVYNLYTGSALDALLGNDNEVGYLGHDTLMPNVTEYAPTVRTPNFGCLEDYDVSLWYFETEGALNSLNDYQVNYIYDSLQGGSLVGIGGDDDLLKKVLATKDYGLDLEPTGEAFYNYLFGISGDSRSDFMVSFDSKVTVGKAWDYILGWVTEQEQEQAEEQASTGGAGLMALSSSVNASDDDTYDPWNAIYNAKISAVGENGDVAETISAYELDTSSETHDWYRVDMNVQGSTYSYYDWLVIVGYYIHAIESGISATAGAELWEHAPETTQTNSSVSYDLGLSLSGEVKKDGDKGGASGKVDVSVGYSKSYDCNEVTIVDYSSHATDKGEWSAQPLGADWIGWPLDYAPSTTAQSSYTYEPSTIWRVDKGDSLELDTYALLRERWCVVGDIHDTWTEAETSAHISLSN